MPMPVPVHQLIVPFVLVGFILLGALLLSMKNGGYLRTAIIAELLKAGTPLCPREVEELLSRHLGKVITRRQVFMVFRSLELTGMVRRVRPAEEYTVEVTELGRKAYRNFHFA